jgi:hypothetical protein
VLSDSSGWVFDVTPGNINKLVKTINVGGITQKVNAAIDRASASNPIYNISNIRKAYGKY